MSRISSIIRYRTNRTILSCAATIALFQIGCMAQSKTPYDVINDAAASSDINVTPARSGISMLDGSGGNITASIGPDGVLLVDAGIAVSRDKIEDALQLLGGTTINYIISTHWHWDHTDGNSWAKGENTVHLALPSTVEYLSSTIRVEEWGHTFTPVPVDELPNETVDKVRSIKFNGDTVRVVPLGSGHTNGDLVVYFERANVLSLGDIFWNGQYPFIDYVAGGGINGAIAQAELALNLANDKTIIIPGHGPIATKADLEAFRDMLRQARDSITKLKSSGKTLEETLAAEPTRELDPVWGKSIINSKIFTTLVYRGVW